MNRKTISKAVALSGVVTLSASICADNASDCHAGELLREIQKQQDNLFLLGKYHSRKEVIHRVIKNYDELNEKLQDVWDMLWSNEAGKLLLRSLCKDIKL